MHRVFLRSIVFVLLLAAGSALFGPAASADKAFISPLAANPVMKPCPIVDSKFYQLIIDKEMQVVTVLRKDTKGKYTIIERQMVCSTGIPPRTSTGSFKIGMVRRWLNSPPKNGRPQSYEQFAVCFNKPIWFHSTVFDKQNTNTLDTESYLNLGKPVSAGCVRLCVREARWIFMNCPRGTVVKVVKSGGPIPICLEPLPPLPDGATHDPTDPAVVR